MGVFFEYVNLRIIICIIDYYKLIVRRKIVCMGINKFIYCVRVMVKYILLIYSILR